MTSNGTRWVRRWAAMALLGLCYGAALLLCRIRGRRRPDGMQSGHILVIGTFHNPNWYLSHIRPLVRSGTGEIVIVADEAAQPLRGVRFECPPRWMQRLFSRAVAKQIWSIRCGMRYRPDLYMGYHIFPCALIALVTARLFRRPACYQDTSGPLELAGGGFRAENRVLRALGWQSNLVNALVNGLVRAFDLVVVRGSGARDYVLSIGFAHRLVVITGSVEPSGDFRDYSQRNFDLAFVGRLTEYKRPDRFVRLIANLAQDVPELTSIVIGDGPDADSLRVLAADLGVSRNIVFAGKRQDVNRLLAQSRVFVLTSRWEGRSIAMLEAMAEGAVPVVADVGDLADSVLDGSNGYVVAGDDIAAYAQFVQKILCDERHWQQLSTRARQTALDSSGVDAVAAQWREHLHHVTGVVRDAAVTGHRVEQGRGR